MKDCTPTRTCIAVRLATAVLIVFGTVPRVATSTDAHAAGAAPTAPCRAAAGAGGEWPLGAHDLAGTRFQPDETTLGPAQAATLAPAWSIDVGAPPSPDSLPELEATPVVSGGCVFVGTERGDLDAINVDTGARVWTHHETVTAAGGGLGGVIVGAPAVDGTRVYVLVNQLSSPYVLALDRSTGAALWRSRPLSTFPSSYSNASPVVWNGLLLAGWSPPEGDPKGVGGVAVIDAVAGTTLATVPTIPPADQARGYAGGGVWTTPAIDATSRVAYYGTGNPYSKQIEHPRTDAILRLDLDRSSPSFGQVTGSYKGSIDQGTSLYREVTRPTCAVLPNNPGVPVTSLPPPLNDFQQLNDSIGCGQMDLDFGGGANILRGHDGRLLVGDLQKSGVYHLIDGASMAPVRKTALGVSCLLCNASSTALDPTTGTVYADVFPSLTAGLAPVSGKVAWRAVRLEGPIHYEPVTLADGVVYSLQSDGILMAFDSHTGLPVLIRSLVADGAPESVGAEGSSGVAVAQHTVIVAEGNHVIAYRASAALPPLSSTRGASIVSRS